MRTVLTGLGVTVAFLLFGIMHGVIASFDTALDKMSETRLRVQSRASAFEAMPIAHAGRILQVEGVKRVVPFSIVAAYYQEPKNGFSSAAMDIEAFLEVIPEIRVPPEQVEAMMRTRTGAIIGVKLAEKYGWSIGDQVPIKSIFWTNEDGTPGWTVEIAGDLRCVRRADEIQHHGCVLGPMGNIRLLPVGALGLGRRDSFFWC